MSTLRVGCAGTGFIAGRHLEALRQLPEVRVVAVADAVPGRARAAAERFGGRPYDDGMRMMEEEELDAVWLCVPPFAHCPLESAALDRGIPFFVEKPVALDLDTPLALAERIRAQGLTTAVCYHWRHLELVTQAADLVREHPARLAMGYWPDRTPSAPWWSRRVRSGGQMLEQTTHICDLLRLLVGEVDTVAAVERTVARDEFPDADVPAVSSASLVFRSGAVGSVSSTCLLEGRHRVRVSLVGEGTVVELAEQSLTEHELRVAGRPGDRVQTSVEDPIAAEDREFVEVLLGGREAPRVPYEEAVRTQRLVLAADRAAREGVAVRLDGDRADG